MLRVLSSSHLSARLIISVCILVITFCIARAEEHTTEVSPQKKFTLDSVQELKEKGEGYKKDMKVPENRYAADGKKEAEKMREYFHSGEFQEKLHTETERVKEALLKDTLLQHNSNSETDKRAAGNLSPKGRIYIFVSSSLPIQTLRRYAMDLDKLSDPNISLVLRGFVEGMKHIRPTLDFVSKILVKDETCDIAKEKCEILRMNFEIDPLLFRRYRITMVPAFVYVPEININDTGMSEGQDTNAEVSDYYVSYGDASLEHILGLIHKETGSKSVGGVLTELRKGFY